MFSVRSVVREDMSKTKERGGEKQRKRNDSRVCAREYIYIRHSYSRKQTKIRYTEGLGSVSPLRVAWARRHLFFPRSNNSWGQPFWELAAAPSYCSTVTLNMRLRERVRQIFSSWNRSKEQKSAYNWLLIVELSISIRDYDKWLLWILILIWFIQNTKLYFLMRLWEIRKQIGWDEWDLCFVCKLKSLDILV